MLHWLAGSKAPDGATDLDSTGYIEPPETPAPVFAVRAFKHAIFGTPQTAQPKARRNSTAENARPSRHGEHRPGRPILTRPKSTSDAQTLMKDPVGLLEDPPSSPTKGILLTPGMAGTRRKNVTFGEHVMDNEEKRATKSGLPDDYPGKFPSPWTRSTDTPNDSQQPVDRKRTRVKLTEALEQARDEAAMRKSKAHVTEEDIYEAGDHTRFADPQSESGKYWKREYDIYRANTTREVKKLITKQRSAKSFAKAKDEQCTQMADHLKHEQARVIELEASTKELSEMLRGLEDSLRKSQELVQKYQADAISLRRELERGEPSRPQTSDGGRPRYERNEIEPRIRQDPVANLQETLAISFKTQPGPVQRPSDPDDGQYQQRRSEEDIAGRTWSLNDQSMHSESLKPISLDASSKSRTNSSARKGDDIWAPSSSPQAPRRMNLVTSSTRDKTVIPAQDVVHAPLKTISNNTVSGGLDSDRTNLIQTPENSTTPWQSNNPAQAQRTSEVKDTWKDGPLLSPSLPMPSFEGSPDCPNRSVSPRRKLDTGNSAVEFSSQIPVSSPFQPDAKTKLAPATIAARAAAELRQIEPAALQSELALSNAPAPDRRETKPSAMWSSINAAYGKRVSTLVGKDGKEVGNERLEAARARIAARGRVVS